MNSSARRAFVLLEMLTTLLLVLVGGTLVTVGLASILKANNRAAELSNRYSIMSDMAARFRRDFRGAQRMSYTRSSDESPETELVLTGPAGKIVYLFAEGQLNRSGPEPAGTAVWPLEYTEVAGSVETSTDGEPAVFHLTIIWKKRKKEVQEFGRRFDLVLRCGGELTSEQ